jgi:2-oxoglutarate ferredoxin oxidoreductase subunit delta
MSEEFNQKGYHYPEAVKSGECVNCNLCEMICPDFAIFSVPLDNGELPAEVESEVSYSGPTAPPAELSVAEKGN